MSSYAKYLPWVMLLIAAVGLYFHFKNYKAIDSWYKGTRSATDSPPPVADNLMIP